MNKILVILFLFITCIPCFAKIIEDEIAMELSSSQKQPLVYTDYNFESTTKIPIKIKIIEPIKSEKDVYEGQVIDFRVIKDVLYKEKAIFKRGDIISGRISTIITPGMNGIPASIIFTDFTYEKDFSGQFMNELEIFGQDRSLFVFPLKWALTPLPPTGSLTNFIMGGHAKIKTKKPITIFYYPEWK